MINLKKNYLDNSIKVGRNHYVPKKYLAGFISLHIGEKASSIFRRFQSHFHANLESREDYDHFVEQTYILGDVKKVITLKDDKYNNIFLNEDYPFTNSLNNGLRLIKEFLHIESINDLTEEVTYRLMSIRYFELSEFLKEKGCIVNCGIDQNLFDFVIARECVANQKAKSPEEIESLFFSLLIDADLIDMAFKNITPSNRKKCLNALRSLSLSTYDPRFEIISLDELKKLSVNELFYHFGTNVDVLVNVINYFSDDTDNVIPCLFKGFLASLNPFVYEILKRREKETLSEIGKSHNLTRERIRQLEVIGTEKFNEFYLNNLCTDSTNLIFVFPKISKVFPLNLFETSLGDDYDTFRTLFKSLKYVGDAKYIEDIDAVVESERVWSHFIRIVDEVLGDYFKKAELEEKIQSCLTSLDYYGFDYETILLYIKNNYKTNNSAFIKHGVRLTRVNEVYTILDSYFDEGFHFSDEEQIKKLNTYAYEEFGDIIFSDEEIACPTKKNILAILSNPKFRLVGRGTYIPISKAPELPMELVEKISTYLNVKNRSIAYSNLFETFQTDLEKVGIDNKYALQGALSIYAGSLFKPKRDYVMPIQIKQTLRESMKNWVLSQTKAFTFEDFQKEFKGVAQSVFLAVVYDEDGFALYWQKGYVNVNNLGILEEDKNKLEQLLSSLIGQYHNEYCSADEIFNLVNISMHDFIVNCGMRYSYDLFSVLQVLFPDKYKFQRPLIGNKNAVFENKYELLETYLTSKNIVNLTKLRKFLNSKSQNKSNDYYTIYNIINDKRNEFIPIDGETIIRKDCLNISSQEITRLDVVIEMLLEEKDTLNIEEDIVNKYIFKELANIKTNKYLVFGLINTYLGNKYRTYLTTKKFHNGTFLIKAQ